jgi:prolyl-tRNA editing enzyme YbaK/EbsC (Cys-tRNA(Pro) deacylase)
MHGGIMSESAMDHLKRYGLADRAQVFEVSSETVELAAAALGCEPARIAKTLSFLVGDRPALVVTAGDMRIDNGKFKAFFHQKAALIPQDAVKRLIGHEVGGVCPFGVKEGVIVYLDLSLKRFDFVYPACGTGASAVKLSPEELERTAEALGWVDVCRPSPSGSQQE